ncbi:MAG: GAF domain-containing protein, partial [Actinomycetia bacterium]|nr:GAF domain-containing protein [Actinomycetes bacterium]
TTHSFKDTMSYMLESAIDFASAKAAAIWVRSNEDDSLTFVKGLHIFGLPSEKKPLKIGDGYTGKAALTKEVIAVADLVKKPDTEHRKAVQNFKIKSLFSIPIKTNEELIGVLNIYTQDKRKVSGEEIELFRKWGETAAVILNSVIINKKENLH